MNRSDPSVSQLEAVAAALRSRNAERAASLAQVCLDEGLRHPMLFTARAVWHAENGRNDAALADFRQATILSPANPAAWSALGICLTALARFDEAVEALDRAITLQPQSAQLYCRKGWALDEGQNLDAARQAFEQALALDPNCTEALSRLASAASRRGDWASARAFAGRALARDPTDEVARLVAATSDIEERDWSRADARLSEFLADARINPRNRARAYGLLGDLRDREDRVGEAFEAYRQSNELARESHPRPRLPNGMTMPEQIVMLTRYFDGGHPRPGATSAVDVRDATHVFLIGFPRSGTTVLELALAAHPGVVTLEEKDPLRFASGDFMASPAALDSLMHAPEEILDRYRDRYWREVRKWGIEPGGKVFVDKGPIYTVDLPVIVRLFPAAKVLFALRDPRDVVWSCYRRRFGLNPTTFEFLSLEGAARFYASVMRLMEIYRARLPVALDEIRHEHLVSDFRSESERICAALGLDWNDAMARFAERDRTVGSASAPQIARGLNPEGVGSWQRYAEQLAPIIPILAPWVEKFGYGE